MQGFTCSPETVQAFETADETNSQFTDDNGLLIGVSGNPVTVHCPYNATSCGPVTSSETSVATASVDSSNVLLQTQDLVRTVNDGVSRYSFGATPAEVRANADLQRCVERNGPPGYEGCLAASNFGNLTAGLLENPVVQSVGFAGAVVRNVVPGGECLFAAGGFGSWRSCAIDTAIEVGTGGGAVGVGAAARAARLRWLANAADVARACSFSGETGVLMADGATKPISAIKVGDMAIAFDPETGERGEREVTHLWVHEDTLFDLQIGESTVTTTEDHPFWNHTDSEWQRADQLDTGDYLLTADGDLLTADGINPESRYSGTAYNLTINDIHTYYVSLGDDEVLVHNTCSFDELGGLAAYVERADLVDGVVEHAAARGRTILPSQVDDALSTTGTRIRDGIPGRDNAVRFELDDLVVIINEDTPWESTAFVR